MLQRAALTFVLRVIQALTLRPARVFYYKTTHRNTHGTALPSSYTRFCARTVACPIVCAHHCTCDSARVSSHLRECTRTVTCAILCTHRRTCETAHAPLHVRFCARTVAPHTQWWPPPETTRIREVERKKKLSSRKC